MTSRQIPSYGGMIMKKKVIIIVVVIALLILLFPIRMQLKDGYSVTKVHSLIPEDEAETSGKVKPYNDGFEIEILGCKIYSNVE
jgi:uncharacterized membrane protein YdfJ with MMPL/SSD domain